MNEKDLLLSMAVRTSHAFAENQIVKSDRPGEQKVCAEMITYKVLRAMYEICKEADETISWEDCVGIMKTTKKLLDATKPVILYTMEDFIENIGFDFDAQPISLVDTLDDNEPGEKDGILHAVRLFPEDYGEALVDFFFLNAEAVFYEQQRNAGKTFTWKEYLLELEKNRPMWDALHNAFYNALDKLDFKVGWTAEDLEEVRFLRDPPTEE